MHTRLPRTRRRWWQYALLSALALLTLTVTVLAIATGPDASKWVDKQSKKGYDNSTGRPK